MSLNTSRSTSSGGRPLKRTLTNSSNNNSNEKKRKNSKQKTLGMAWGSNSLSASRSSSSFHSSPFSNFGSYMVEKNRKLKNQFDAEASSSSLIGSSSGKPIFHGVSIFVDGFTIPSSQELRGYMLKYGGRFENYFSRHRVTHIICSNLPESKIKNLRSFSCGLPVVKPAWIMDSVAANRQLDWVSYQLDQLASNQPKLSAFFSLKNSLLPEDGLTDTVSQQRLDLFLKGDTLNDTHSSDLIESSKDRNQVELISDHPEPDIEESSCSRRNTVELRMDKPGHSDADDAHNEDPGIQYSHCQLPSLHVDHCLDNQDARRSPSSPAVGSSKQHHSTVEDPNFVENYFKSSRLHFIGTWRNRYRKHFPGPSNEFKCRNSPENEQKRTIIHIDMDCFFVSVVIKNHPELLDKPVAVCHSNNPKGTAEISSANYPARHYGVKAGIFVRDAKALCPELIIFPYNFQAYEEVADQFYHILHKYCNKVQAVSCDEAFLDITGQEEGNPEILASTIRKDILETTGCTASAGIAGNMLMARLATRSAKPDGQRYIPPEKADVYLEDLPVKALPGIGHVLEEKLKQRSILTCGQLRKISKVVLQRDFGQKTGEMLWNFSRGVDNRFIGVIQEARSVGAEVNWGVRFKDLQDSQRFMLKLCKEVALRLQGCGMVGRTFTLKIKKRRKDAEEPVKYMGCGDCENLSHSITVPMATDEAEMLERIGKKLFGFFHLDVREIRGVGLQVSKLESSDSFRQGIGRNSLRSWLTSASVITRDHSDVNYMCKDISALDSEWQNMAKTTGSLVPNQAGTSLSSSKAYSNPVSTPPPLSSLDIGVVESLPSELLSELDTSYGGKLKEFIAKSKVSYRNASSIPGHKKVEGAIFGDYALSPQRINLEEKENHYDVDEAQSALFSEAGFHGEAVRTTGIDNNELMPTSISQVDTSVLQQLPEELRSDILGSLPAHRRPDEASIAPFGPNVEKFQESVDITTTEKQSFPVDCFWNRNLWKGNPPCWVDKFRVSNCLILSNLGEMYHKMGGTCKLSTILQGLMSQYPHFLDDGRDGWSLDDIKALCELLNQYIELKIEYDIEEINTCFRLMKRFSAKARIMMQVYDTVLPFLQASVEDCYGGKLQLSSNE